MGLKMLNLSQRAISRRPAGLERPILIPSETLRVVRVGEYDDCACIGAHVGNTSEIGEFRIISHDFADGVWMVRWKVSAK